MHDFRAFEYLYFRRRTEISPFVRCVFSSRVAGQQVFKLTVSLFSNSLGTNEVNASRGRTFGIKKKGEREDAGLRSIPVRDRHRRKKLDPPLSSPPLFLLGVPSPGFKIELDEKRVRRIGERLVPPAWLERSYFEGVVVGIN